MDTNTLVYEQIPQAMDIGEYNNMLSAMEQAYWHILLASQAFLSLQFYDGKSLYYALQLHKWVNLLFISAAS